MSTLGTEQNPLRIAIVGAGPSGFYAAEALIKSKPLVQVDLIERLPSPFGLVRSGVAPDHPKLKQAILVYQKIAQSPDFNFVGNVTVGKDISVAELHTFYHAVILTCGAETDRTLGIPGEQLHGSYTATEFVGWYNGHPDYRDCSFDLSQEVAVIIGQGNVAMDVSRILAKTVDELKTTDIAEHALDALAESKIKEIHVVGRRGPAQAKFTHLELRELGELEDCDPIVNIEDLQLNPASQEELTDKSNRANIKNFETLQKFAERTTSSKHRRCHFHFLKGPVELAGSGRVERIVLALNRLEGEANNQWAETTSETEEFACGLVFRSIGYRGIAMPGVPFDDRKGLFPNLNGHILKDDNPVPGLYTAGWIKRGPTGIIGTNRACAVETVSTLLNEVDNLGSTEKTGFTGLQSLLSDREIRSIDYGDWQKIETVEVERGNAKGKPREKFTRVEEMLAVLN